MEKIRAVFETEYLAQGEGAERMGAFVVKFRDVKCKFWFGCSSFSDEIAEPSLLCCICCFAPKSIHQMLFGIRSGVPYRIFRVFPAEDAGSLAH